MSGIDNRILNFDRGVEGILIGSTPGVAKLPQSVPLTPWDGQVEARLERIFQSPSREQALREALKPPPLHPSLLNPGNFRDQLRACGERLKKAARGRSDLREGAEVLEELLACEELLAAYRNSLKQA